MPESLPTLLCVVGDEEHVIRFRRSSSVAGKMIGDAARYEIVLPAGLDMKNPLHNQALCGALLGVTNKLNSPDGELRSTDMKAQSIRPGDAGSQSIQFCHNDHHSLQSPSALWEDSVFAAAVKKCAPVAGRRVNA